MNPLMILMLAFALGASATTYSQKLVSLDLHDSSVLQLFREVKKQTGLRFVFNEDYVKEFPAINVSAEEEDVKELLNQIFASSPLECRFENDVKEVQNGFECGMTIANFNDIKVGDIIELFEDQQVEVE